MNSPASTTPKETEAIIIENPKPTKATIIMGGQQQQQVNNESNNSNSISGNNNNKSPKRPRTTPNNEQFQKMGLEYTSLSKEKSDNELSITTTSSLSATTTNDHNPRPLKRPRSTTENEDRGESDEPPSSFSKNNNGTISATSTTKITSTASTAALPTTTVEPAITSITTTSNNEESTTTSSTPSQQQSSFKEMVLDAKDLENMACRNCIFCRMPRCERCFGCCTTVDDGKEEPVGQHEEQPFNLKKKEGRGYCLRKTCIAIPIELKLRDASKLGFPPGWKFAFDEPQKLSMILSTKKSNNLTPPGLKLVSPQGTVFHSLESAFAHMFIDNNNNNNNDHQHQHPLEKKGQQLSVITNVLENFLVHIGSSRYISIPHHFLVGKNYCVEFTTATSAGGTQKRGLNNVVLFGKIIACMGQQPNPSSSSSNNNEDDKSFFIIRYDTDALSIARSMMKSNDIPPPIQMITSDMAWGGCISYERKTCCRRDSKSAIQNIDQATAAETWVAPDMRLEEMVEYTTLNGMKLPRLIVFARGYKFVFRVRMISSKTIGGGENNKEHFGVFASCTSMQESGNGRTNNQEINLKPGELIDLGVLSPPADDEDEENSTTEGGNKKTLSSFIVKNFVHKYKMGRWGVVSGHDNYVHDLTDERTGKLSAPASERVLSYFRKRGKGEFPTINARIGPDMRVHFLFGVQYQGNWAEYEAGMQELVPLFSGREVEVTVSRHYGFGSKQDADAKHLQCIGMFQMDDIVASVRQLERCLLDSSSSRDNGSSSSTSSVVEEQQRFPFHLVERAKQVVICLEERGQTILDMLTGAKKSQSNGRNGDDSSIIDESPLVSALDKLKELSRILDQRHS